MQQQLALGDVVRLKGIDGPLMVIIGRETVRGPAEWITCAWFAEGGAGQRGSFPEQLLVKVEKPDGG
jgi:uncharacterized protein YodC (DUF2158 family)